MGSFADILSVASKKYGNRTAIVFESNVTSYKDWDIAVNRVANAMLAAGLKKGDTVAILSWNSDQVVTVNYAAARIGVVIVPLNPMLVGEEVTKIIRRAKCQWLFYSCDFKDMVEHIIEQINVNKLVYFGSKDSENLIKTVAVINYNYLRNYSDTQEPVVVVDDDDPATIIFTSGTMGLPKGCVKSHKNQTWSAVNNALQYPRDLNDKEIFAFQVAGIAFATFFSWSVVTGTPIYLMKRFDAKEALKLISQAKITTGIIAPTMLNAMLNCSDFKGYDLTSLKHINIAYEIDMVLRKKLVENFGNIFYYWTGLTEAGATSAPAELFLSNPSCVGKHHGIGEFKVVNDDGAECKVGEVGEIIYRGPSVMIEYLDDPETTAVALKNGWLYSGDLGRIDDEANLYFVSRKKDMIKSGGMNVFAMDVENVLATYPKVFEVGVIGVPDRYWGEAVRAIVSPVKGEQLTEAELMEFSKEHLASFKRPKSYVIVDELLKTATGKIQKGELRKLYGQPTE